MGDVCEEVSGGGARASPGGSRFLLPGCPAPPLQLRTIDPNSLSLISFFPLFKEIFSLRKSQVHVIVGNEVGLSDQSPVTAVSPLPDVPSACLLSGQAACPCTGAWATLGSQHCLPGSRTFSSTSTAPLSSCSRDLQHLRFKSSVCERSRPLQERPPRPSPVLRAALPSSWRERRQRAKA